jgi:hypothetical protein
MPLPLVPLEKRPQRWWRAWYDWRAEEDGETNVALERD